MKHFGLDIGTGSIKIVQLEKEEGKERLLGLGEVKNPFTGKEIPQEMMTKTAEAIKKLRDDLEIKSKLAVVALPEDEVISRVIVFPPLKEKEVAKALFYEVETFVPYPKEKIQLDYQIIEKRRDRIFVFVVATQKKTVARYEELLKMAGLIPLALETTAVALVRALVSPSPEPVMIVDLGAKNSTMTVAKNGSIYLTRVIRLGGDAFTRAISLSLGMEFFKAEEYKKTYGFQTGQWENKIRQAMIEVFDHLAEEIKKGILSFKEEWGERVKLLILSGGGANMPGLMDELIKILGIEVQIAHPLAGVDFTGAKIISENYKDDARFSVPVGLAKRER